MPKKKYYTGTSGFHYKSWKEKFYPGDMHESDWLSFYAQKFNSVEINNSFYRLPDKGTLDEWNSQTPKEFRFTLKGSRYTTHMKKLKMDADLRDSVRTFYDTVFTLGDKLACVLWQLPGNLHRDDEKLEAFCKLLSKDVLNCLEFRHESWINDSTLDTLDKHGTGFCVVSSPDSNLEYVASTGNMSYFRFHGENKSGNWYDYDYSDQELGKWAKEIKKSKASTLFSYFNNDMHGFAPKNALTLLKQLNG